MLTGYLSYKYYKGASGASTLKKLGQAPDSPQPLTDGLNRLQQQQQLNQQQQHSQQQQPYTDSAGVYTGFAPNTPEPGTEFHPYSRNPSDESYPSNPSQAPRKPSPSAPGYGVPSDQNPQSYQSMLDSLPSTHGAGYSDGPVHYPNIQNGMPTNVQGQNSAAASGYLAQATGKL